MSTLRKEIGFAAFPRAEIRPLAWYLPQFYPIAENDLAWGKGFTEWTNTASARPRFPGHYQPRLPGALGFYDLRLKEVMQAQTGLARHAGIYGFCMHHYWFNGKKILHTPLDHLRENPDLDFRFCLHWANEPWTKVWDGTHGEIIIGQEHSPEDDLAFIENIAWALGDPRYIRRQGRPMLGVYRPEILPDMRATAGRWRKYCLDRGIGEIFIFVSAAFKSWEKSPAHFGADAFVQYPPHNCPAPVENQRWLPPNSAYRGTIRDYAVMRDLYLEKTTSPYSEPHFRGVMPGWDNSARSDSGMILVNDEPAEYGLWLRQAVSLAAGDKYEGEKYVFINAWNEWAEGAYLEPDDRYGFARLNETAKACDAAPPDLPRCLLAVDFDDPARVAQAKETLAKNLARPGYRAAVLSLGPALNSGTFYGLAPLLAVEADAGPEKIREGLAASGLGPFALGLYFGNRWDKDRERLKHASTNRFLKP